MLKQLELQVVGVIPKWGTAIEHLSKLLTLNCFNNDIHTQK